MIVSGQLIDIRKKEIYPAEVHVSNGKIQAIKRVASAPKQYLLPGFIDAHVHIESAMLVPSAFAPMAAVHGTVATVSDPHEIANVLGVKGVEYMIDNGQLVNFKFYFGAPSCVPATPFETAGATIDADDIRYLLEKPAVKYLAEMMNWPGVLQQDSLVMDKIRVAQELGKPVDGHAPGLKGEQAATYISRGIATDHECFTAEEALDKLKYGMKILIREGSAAKNFEALIPLLDEHYEHMMFCSDDKHPDDLVRGHINELVKRAITDGYDLYKVLQAACINPIEHYKLDVGHLNVGDPADFIIVNNLKDWRVLATYINGEQVAHEGIAKMPEIVPDVVNQFAVNPITENQLAVAALGDSIRVIQALDGQLITEERHEKALVKNNYVQADVANDILKFVVVNRYKEQQPAIGFIKGFGLQYGAIASCVGHDSHNILAVGTDDASLTEAINTIIAHKGGIVAHSTNETKVLPLPIAGIMSTESGTTVAKAYEEIDALAKEMGSPLHAPYMTLSFMALLVIPQLKLSDKGLFDGQTFTFASLFV